MFYLLPCMEDILPPIYLKHAAKLIAAVYLLNKRSISPDDIKKSRNLLVKFHQRYCTLYGIKIIVILRYNYIQCNACIIGARHATINLHYLLHFPEAVQQLGPIWANTCYEFENTNGVLKKLYHGTKQIDNQVATYTIKLCMHHAC